MGKNQSRSSWVRWLLVGAVCVSTVLSPLALPARPAHAQPPQEVLTTALQQVREQLSQLLEVYQSADAEAQAAIDAATVQAVRQTLQQTYWSLPADDQAQLDHELQQLTGYTWLQLWQGVSTIPELVNAVDLMLNALEDLYGGEGISKGSSTQQTKFREGAVLTGISGEVKIRTAEGELKSCRLGATLNPGDTVITGANSKVVIKFPDDDRIELGSMSHFTIRDYEKGIFGLLIGKIRALIKGKLVKYQVETPTAVMAVRGTEFTINVDDDGTTTVVVLEGIVEVRDLTSNSIVLLEAFQMITVPKIPGGFEQQDMLERVTIVDPGSISRWWEEELLTTGETPVVLNTIVIDSPFGLSMPSPGIYTYETSQASLKLQGRVQGITSLSRLTVANIEVPAVPVGEGVYKFNVDLRLVEGKNGVEIRAEYEDGSVVTGGFEVLRSGPYLAPSGSGIAVVVVVIIIVIVLILVLLLTRKRSRGQVPVKETSAEWLETLKTRLAKGEISEEKYEELKKRLKET